MTEEKTAAPVSHWRRRAKWSPIPRDQAIRQGSIARLAFILLGRDAAINFLNTESPDLGGCPLAIATASAAGEATVRTKLQELSAVSVGMDERAFPS
jgi:hypothetical protein